MEITNAGPPVKSLPVHFAVYAGLVALCSAPLSAAYAQEPVVGVIDPDALFTSPDPKLHANKQIVYHIQKDLLEAGRWAEADKWLTERYIQHNPNAASGLVGVVTFFTQTLKVQPKPIAPKISTSIVAVMAEGDLVTVIRPYVLTDPKDSTKTYSTTWFDTWRIVGGKADEHWDSALKN